MSRSPSFITLLSVPLRLPSSAKRASSCRSSPRPTTFWRIQPGERTARAARSPYVHIRTDDRAAAADKHAHDPADVAAHEEHHGDPA